jgi:hypothetical protein
MGIKPKNLNFMHLYLLGHAMKRCDVKVLSKGRFITYINRPTLTSLEVRK